MLEISDIEMQKSDKTNTIHIKIQFKCHPSELDHFGILNEFYSVTAIETSIAEFSEYKKSIPAFDFDKEFVKQEDGSYLWVPSHPSPYDLGHVKRRSVEGKHTVRADEENEDSYIYEEWATDCKPVRALLSQLMEMQSQLNTEKDGTFRSGEAMLDFATILLALDLFWD